MLYSFDVADYRLADLPSAMGLDHFYGTARSYIENIENGNLIPIDFIVLGGIALLGLVLLVLELKPRSPRRVQLQQGTYATRSAVENEISQAVEQVPEVLQADVKVKARRRPGAKLGVKASVRPGEDIQGLRSGIQDRAQQHLDRRGVPVGKLKVRLVEFDPRETKTRVK